MKTNKETNHERCRQKIITVIVEISWMSSRFFKKRLMNIFLTKSAAMVFLWVQTTCHFRLKTAEERWNAHTPRASKNSGKGKNRQKVFSAPANVQLWVEMIQWFYHVIAWSVWKRLCPLIHYRRILINRNNIWSIWW